MGNMVMVPENLMATEHATVVAGSEASVTMAAENLLIESPSKFWRSSSNIPDNVTLLLALNDQVAVSASLVALVKHNLYRGDQYRFISMDSATIQAESEYKPTGTISETNATSASGTGNHHLDIDDYYVPAGTWITPTTGTDWSIRFSFDTPGSPPAVGVGHQAFWIYVRAASAVTYGSRAPTVKCELFETGGVTTIADLGTKTISSSTGQWMFFSWNAASLVTASGAAVEIKLTFAGRSFGVSSGYPAGNLGSITWRADRTGTQGVDDSGWITFDPFAGGSVSRRPVTNANDDSIMYQLPSVLSINKCYVWIRSDRAPTDYNSLTEILPTLYGYVQVGTLVYGETWSPTINIGYGKLVGAIDPSPSTRTYGGQLLGSRRPVRRAIGMRLSFLTPVEAHTLFDRILWRHGIMKPILISLLPDDTTQSKHTTILASLKNPENWINIQPAEGVENAMDMEWEEYK